MFADIEELGATLVGVSTDSLESHRAFAEGHGLEFPLLADPEGRIAAAFGVSTEGGYAERVTFVIGADGRIAEVFPEVTIDGHAEEVVASLRELAGEAPRDTPGSPR